MLSNLLDMPVIWRNRLPNVELGVLWRRRADEILQPDEAELVFVQNGGFCPVEVDHHILEIESVDFGQVGEKFKIRAISTKS